MRVLILTCVCAHGPLCELYSACVPAAWPWCVFACVCSVCDSSPRASSRHCYCLLLQAQVVMLCFEDEIKPGAGEALASLMRQGKNVVMLTGEGWGAGTRGGGVGWR